MKNLKAVRLRSAINFDKKKLEERKAEFEELEKRNDQLAKAIEEAETEEDQKIVDEQIEEFEKDKTATETEIADLEKKIEESEEELKEIEEVNKDPLVAERDDNKKIETRNENKMHSRAKKGEFMINNVRFKEMNLAERTAFTQKDSVSNFISDVRSLIQRTSGVSPKEVIIPTEFLEFFYAELPYSSKVFNKVTVSRSKAKGRIVILGDKPKLVWTESDSAISESGITFNGLEIDEYKAACYVAIDNSIIEDNDVDLVGKLLRLLVEAAALAYDEAILVGTGKKQPTGILTSLKTKTQPDGYPTNGRKWEDLTTKNVAEVTGKGVDLFKNLMNATKNVKKVNGDLHWFCSRATKIHLKAEALGTNNNAMIVVGMNDELPGVGGKIDEVDFLEDGVIIGGYMKNYEFVERKTATLDISTDCKFTDDQTVYRMKERADGKPVIRESFAVITIKDIAKSGK